ncbi:uncharacterized protein LOC134212100 [Armigeres subalbatus]|uniref:uncharacterized protein LOC134212100 n=1 Tax=Armigeres subalbatus TaxID=124917 RepID=UPI002ED30549
MEKFSMERLGSDNYESWSFQLKSLLMREELWKYVTSIAPEPVTDAWTNGDTKTQGTISLFVGVTQQSLILHRTHTCFILLSDLRPYQHWGLFRKERKLCDESLATVLAEKQSMVNSWPLAFIPVGTASQESLTPNHFLFLFVLMACMNRRSYRRNGVEVQLDWNMVKHK